jgi:hypothetical protein
LLTAVIGIGNAARGEVILDDFDDPASVVAPAMLDEFIDTLSVGHFSAERSIRIASFAAEPEGRIDVDAGGSSALIARLGKLNAANTSLSKIASVQSNYNFTLPGLPFSFVDVSEGGRNNAVLLDFKELRSAMTPSFLRILFFSIRLRPMWQASRRRQRATGHLP